MIRTVIGHVLEFPADRLFRLPVPSAAVSRVQFRERNGYRFGQLLFHAGKR